MQEKTPAFREEAGAKVYSITREELCIINTIMLHCSNASAAIIHFAFTLRNGYVRCILACSQMGTSLRIRRGFLGGGPRHFYSTSRLIYLRL